MKSKDDNKEEWVPFNHFKRISLDGTDRRIITCLKQGHTSKEIGKRLFLSARTIETRVSKIRTFYGAKNNAHLIALISVSGQEPDIKKQEDSERKARLLLTMLKNPDSVTQLIEHIIAEHRGSIQFWNDVISYIPKPEQDA